MKTKQVFIVRKDLNMRKGKIASQVAHGSLAFLTRNGNWTDNIFSSIPSNYDEAKEWMEESYTKITCSVDSEQELDEIYNKAKKAGLETHLIIDNGLTEFNGVPTKTIVAIGPHYSEKIDPITKHLKLL